MSDPIQYRDTGAVGALLDEYERAIIELSSVIEHISNKKLSHIVDTLTKDKDCRSIQTILTHVVSAGYAYAKYIRRHQGEEVTFMSPPHLDSSEEYRISMQEMFRFTEKVFRDYPDLELETKYTDKKMLVSWGQYYDVEQLLEHAIVHILRHRRQIERFLLKMK